MQDFPLCSGEKMESLYDLNSLYLLLYRYYNVTFKIIEAFHFSSLALPNRFILIKLHIHFTASSDFKG